MLKQSAAAKFPGELKQIKYEIQEHALGFGLDFFPVIFEVLDYQTLNEVAAYGGFPHRYPHWRFGMQFEELAKSYAYGLSKIYEMVINNDPCYAYLLKCNGLVDQKLVIAHVYGHCDFFKNNLFFSHTNRKMVDEMANHATRIRRYMDRYGTEHVENFIDCCLSVENLIDPHAPGIKRRDAASREPVAVQADPHAGCSGSAGSCADDPKKGACPGKADPASNPGGCSCEGGEAEDLFVDDEGGQVNPQRLRSKGYMDTYINPPEFLRERAEEIRTKKRLQRSFPENPEPDVLLFLVENAPLKNWQRDVLSIVREEATYFLPQGQTKIMNEGWATYWHSRIMTEKALNDGEVVDYADHHAGTLGGSRLRLNPYKLGLEIFRDIEERWDRGMFGREYEECDDLATRDGWDRKLGLGREKIFEVRRLYNDLTFLDTFLTEDFCRRQKLFVFAKKGKDPTYVIETREFRKIKETILEGLTNLGQPLIRIVDGNFENRGELLFKHEHEGRDLRPDFSSETLVNLYRLWKRPVHVETLQNGKEIRVGFDGKECVVKGLT